jgi:hypothetical protein
LVNWNRAHSPAMLDSDEQTSPRFASFFSPAPPNIFLLVLVPTSHRPLHTPVSSKGRMCLPINGPITRTQHAGIDSECNHHSGDPESWGLQQKGVQSPIRPPFVISRPNTPGDREERIPRNSKSKGCEGFGIESHRVLAGHQAISLPCFNKRRHHRPSFHTAPPHQRFCEPLLVGHHPSPPWAK